MTEQSSFANGAYDSQYEAAQRRGFDPAAATKEVQAAATDLEHYVRELVRERPVVAVLTAAGLGYFMARIFARGMR